MGYRATQSSSWSWGQNTFEAHLAVDGDATTNFAGSTCTATNHQPYPWWALDLKGKFAVTKVTLVNRLKACKSNVYLHPNNLDLNLEITYLTPTLHQVLQFNKHINIMENNYHNEVRQNEMAIHGR